MTEHTRYPVWTYEPRHTETGTPPRQKGNTNLESIKAEFSANQFRNDDMSYFLPDAAGFLPLCPVALHTGPSIS